MQSIGELLSLAWDQFGVLIGIPGNPISTFTLKNHSAKAFYSLVALYNFWFSAFFAYSIYGLLTC